ncbi:hypothetical protein [Roseiflexus castenholzii]|uniref:hypothetical protein n=1 Tax=Roseiflexus castenholzii TaxID=120962 RepID=UPI0012ECD096|nr:hypothetical protein [Roseiflexus castenholzii]
MQHADRLVLWNYFGLNGTSPEYTRDIAQYVQRYSADRIIISYGLWADRNAVVSATDLQRAMIAGKEGNLPHAWITPVRLMNDDHWQAITSVWRTAVQRRPTATPLRSAPDR